MYVGDHSVTLFNHKDDADPDSPPFVMEPGQADPVCAKCLESNPDPNLKVLGFAEYHKAQLKYLVEQSMDWVTVYLDDAEEIRSYFNELLDKYITESVMKS